MQFVEVSCVLTAIVCWPSDGRSEQITMRKVTCHQQWRHSHGSALGTVQPLPMFLFFYADAPILGPFCRCAGGVRGVRGGQGRGRRRTPETPRGQSVPHSRSERYCRDCQLVTVLCSEHCWTVSRKVVDRASMIARPPALTQLWPKPTR